MTPSAGGQTTYYVHGLDLVWAADNSGVQSYFLYDGLGSTRQLTDAAGSVAATYDYDGFGAVRAQTGSQPNELQFTGEQVDDVSGLEYLRARYYDPALGRFMTQDPIGSLNRYAYGLNNPLRWLDPWGLCNVESTTFGTPTPPGNYRVWGPVTPAGGCPNAHYLAPGSGGGIDWGKVAGCVGGGFTGYWQSHQSDVTYIDMYRASSDWFMNTCAGQATRLGVGVATFAAGGILAGAGQWWGFGLMSFGVAIANPGPPSPLLENCW